jgi:hypothetical protein
MIPRALRYGARGLLISQGAPSKVSSWIRTSGCVGFKLLRSSLQKSGRLDVCNMKLISREFEFEQPLRSGTQLSAASSTSGWDPYDVWCTRVRGEPRPTVELPLSRRVIPPVVRVTPERASPAKVSKKERAAMAVLAVVFGLVILFALMVRESADKSKLPVHLDSHLAGCPENHLVGQCGRQRSLDVRLVGQVLAVQSVTKAARPGGKAGLAVH